MFFLNLTGAEFFALLGVLGGLVTALYLLDRAKRRKTVSTLRFWVNAGASEERQAKRRMREPWSLLLQLASLLLLLLAVARLQFGNRGHNGRDHVILLDTSSWSGAADVLSREKTQVRRYLAALPTTDRVMLVAADSLATPLTSFTQDRHATTEALTQANAGFSSLNIAGTLAFAHQAQSWSGGASGEIVYVGPQLVDDATLTAHYANLRILEVKADRENSGIRRLTVDQMEDEPNSWQTFVAIKNYGKQPCTLRLDVHYGGTAFTPRQLSIPGDSERTAEYRFTTRVAGELVASITPGGSLRSDDRAGLFLPRYETLRVAVYTDRPEALKPLLAINGQLTASFFEPAQYLPHPQADIMILDRMAPLLAPALPSLFIDPPSQRSPLAVKTVVTDSSVSWNAKSLLESALRAKPLRLPSATVFQIFEGDNAIASVPQGPVVVARPADRTHMRSAVIGFDPASGKLRFEVASPLLFANLLEWIEPAAFRAVDLTAERVGLVELNLTSTERANPLQVTNDRGDPIPFTRRSASLEFFVARPSTIHVLSAERERMIGLNLPSVADHLWQAPSDSASGLPFSALFTSPAMDLWKWLALAGGLGLLLEWILFSGRRRTFKQRKQPVFVKPESVPSAAREEFVSK